MLASLRLFAIICQPKYRWGNFEPEWVRDPERIGDGHESREHFTENGPRPKSVTDYRKWLWAEIGKKETAIKIGMDNK
jgi:hypothetical protein